MAYEKHHESNSLAALARQVAAAAAAGTLPPPRPAAAVRPPPPAAPPAKPATHSCEAVDTRAKRRRPPASAPAPPPVAHWGAADRAAAVARWLGGVLPAVGSATLTQESWHGALVDLEARTRGPAPDVAAAAAAAATAAVDAPPPELGGVPPAVQAALFAYKVQEMVAEEARGDAGTSPDAAAAAFAAAFEAELEPAMAADGQLMGMAVAALVGEGTDGGWEVVAGGEGPATVGGL